MKSRFDRLTQPAIIHNPWQQVLALARSLCHTENVSEPQRGAVPDDNELRTTVRSLIERAVSDPVLTYEQQVEALRKLRSAFHQELAAAFEPHFNAGIRAMPHETLDEKRALCAMSNDVLKSLGLAIRAGNHAAILVADRGPPQDPAGRFRLEIRDKGRVRRPLYSKSLPAFELVEHSVRLEPFASKYRRTRHEDEGPTR